MSLASAVVLVREESVQALNSLSIAEFKRHIRWRPYRVECTGSLPTSEVKRRRARLVLGWGTAREDLRVLPAFHVLRLNALALPAQLVRPNSHIYTARVWALLAKRLEATFALPHQRGRHAACSIVRVRVCGVSRPGRVGSIACHSSCNDGLKKRAV